MTPTEKKIAIGGVGVVVVGGLAWLIFAKPAAASTSSTVNPPPTTTPRPPTSPVVIPGGPVVNPPPPPPQTAVVPNVPLVATPPALTDTVSNPSLILIAQAALMGVANTIGLPAGILYPNVSSPGVVDPTTLQAVNAFRLMFPGWSQVSALDYQTLAALVSMYASQVPGAAALPMVSDPTLVTMAQQALAKFMATQGPSIYGLSDVNGDPSDVKFQAALKQFQALAAASLPSALKDGRLDFTTWAVLIMTTVH